MFWCGCANCDSTFPLKDRIDVHLENPYGDPVATVTCPKCGATQDYGDEEVINDTGRS